MKTSYELKKDVHGIRYKKQYNAWNEQFTDDRQLFCNMYEILGEAIEDMKNITNNTIWVAFNHYLADEYKIMDAILSSFGRI